MEKVIFFIYGICIGSFLNVVVYRLPEKMPIAKGRSMCPKCQHMLNAWDLVPVFSFLFLGRKCRYCSEPISWRYPLVELLTGVLFLLAANKFGFSIYAVLICLYFSVLVVAWFIDFDHTYIPDRLHIIIFLLAILSYFTGPELSIVNRLLGAVLIVGFMMFINLITKGGIGLGDVKLLGVSALLVGGKLIFVAFFLAYIIATIYLLPGIIKKQIPMGCEIPMAPFFSIALIIVTLYGNDIINYYFSLF